LHFSTIVDAKFVDPAPYLSKNGDRSLSAPALATFRKWQHDIRAAAKGTRDHQRRDYGYELVMIGEEQDRLASPLFAFTNVVTGGLSRWMTANHAAAVTPLNARGNPAVDAP
jgi:hypothetical protein